jgi:peptidoglycan/LPS O-acetylase OafA/YrhL
MSSVGRLGGGVGSLLAMRRFARARGARGWEAEMYRTIAAAAIVFAFAAFALRHTTVGGALEEPLLLLLMGTLFLVVGKLFKGPARKPTPAPQMVQREA